MQHSLQQSIHNFVKNDCFEYGVKCRYTKSLHRLWNYLKCVGTLNLAQSSQSVKEVIFMWHLSVCRSLSTVSDRAFLIAAARVWNSLPQHIKSAPSPSVFRSRLKTHILRHCFPWLHSPCSYCCAWEVTPSLSRADPGVGGGQGGHAPPPKMLKSPFGLLPLF